MSLIMQHESAALRDSYMFLIVLKLEIEVWVEVSKSCQRCYQWSSKFEVLPESLSTLVEEMSAPSLFMACSQP